jgi:hypothetical protein
MSQFSVALKDSKADVHRSDQHALHPAKQGLQGLLVRAGVVHRNCSPSCGCAVCRAQRGHHLNPHTALALQRVIGNQAAIRLLAARSISNVISASGEELEPAARTAMEQRFGTNFSYVRVHRDSQSAASAQALDAHAYTAGNHIVFANGRSNLSSAEGQRTLAHELAHVVQQRSGPVSGVPIGDGISVSDRDDSFEREAESRASEVAEHASFDRMRQGYESPANAVPVQRSLLDDVGEIASDAGSALTSGVESLVDTGANLASTAGSAVTSGAEPLAEAGSDVVSGTGSALASGASSAVETATGILSDVGSAIASGASSAVSGVTDVVAGAVAGAEGLASDALDWATKEGAGILGGGAAGAELGAGLDMSSAAAATTGFPSARCRESISKGCEEGCRGAISPGLCKTICIPAAILDQTFGSGGYCEEAEPAPEKSGVFQRCFLVEQDGYACYYVCPGDVPLPIPKTDPKQVCPEEYLLPSR